MLNFDREGPDPSELSQEGTKSTVSSRAQRRREREWAMLEELNQIMFRWGGQIIPATSEWGRKWEVHWRRRRLVCAERYGEHDMSRWHFDEAVPLARRLVHIAESWEGWV